MDQAVIDAVIADWKTAPVSKRLRAALKLLETQTLRPFEITTDFVSELRDAGLDDVAMEDIIMTGYHFNFINRVSDACDFPLPDPKQQWRQARILNFLGRWVPPGIRPDPSWAMGKGNVIRPAEIDTGRDHLFNVQGATDPDLRRAVEACAAVKWRGVRPQTATKVPDELVEYLNCLALHAYQITDEQIARLKSSGFTDEQLFEITFAAAFGSAMPALENLFGVLYGMPAQ